MNPRQRELVRSKTVEGVQDADQETNRKRKIIVIRYWWENNVEGSYR